MVHTCREEKCGKKANDSLGLPNGWWKIEQSTGTFAKEFKFCSMECLKSWAEKSE